MQFSEPITIGVDTGNRCIKTASQVMVAGLYESDLKPTFHDDKTIKFNGKFYQVSNDRCGYRRDKTRDDNYFILTLIAIMAELKTRGIPYGGNAPVPSITLCVGLPPAHIQLLREPFTQYFKRGLVTFEYGGEPVTIQIAEVFVFPQCYSAAFRHYNEIKKMPSAYVVDIGGYTTDIVKMEFGVVNPTSFSEDAGMIHLYNRIADEMNILFGVVPSEQQIDLLLSDPSYHLEDGMKERAQAIAKTYVANLLRKLQEKGINLRLNKAIFVGGGTCRLAPYLSSSEFVRDPIIITDIKANADGYESFAVARKKKAAAN